MNLPLRYNIKLYIHKAFGLTVVVVLTCVFLWLAYVFIVLMGMPVGGNYLFG